MATISITKLIKECKKGTLLKDLIWPAVAGNVAWTFFSVLLAILQPQTQTVPVTEPAAIGRLTAIFLLSCYLGIVYLMSCAEASAKSNNKRHAFDMLHSLTIILCAIAFQLKFNANFCNICLTIFWLVAAVGHLCGAWKPSSDTKFEKQAYTSLISVSGIILCWTLAFLDNGWNLAISLLTGLLFWAFFRHKFYDQ